MRWMFVLVLSALLAGCAGGGTGADQARDDHDLSAIGNAGLALKSQVRTDADDVGDVMRRAGVPPS